MSSLPKNLEITVTKEQPETSKPETSNPKSDPSKTTTTTGNETGQLDKNQNMLLAPRTPPYRTGAKKEPGSEDDPCEDAIASGDVTPSWEGVWRKDRRDTQHQGPGGGS